MILDWWLTYMLARPILFSLAAIFLALFRVSNKKQGEIRNIGVKQILFWWK